MAAGLVEVVVDDDGRTGSIGIRGRAETGSDGGRAGIVKSAWDRVFAAGCDQRRQPRDNDQQALHRAPLESCD